MMDFSTYRVSVGGFLSLDLTLALNSQPLQLMVKDADSGDYAYSMLVWHRNLLYPDAEREDRAAGARARREARAAAAAAAAAW